MSDRLLTKSGYVKEYWTGDSRDGRLVNGDGYHYYFLSDKGLITEAYEFYELEDGTEVVSPMPEMHNVNWFDDLGFDDVEALDFINENEFTRIKGILSQPKQ